MQEQTLNAVIDKAMARPRKPKWAPFKDTLKLLEDAKRSGLDPQRPDVVEDLKIGSKPTRLALEWNGDRYAETEFYSGKTVGIGKVEA